MLTEIINDWCIVQNNYGYWILYIFSWLVIVNSKDENGIHYICQPVFITAIIIFNPLAAIILDKCLQGSYWRSLWLMLEYVVISLAAVLLIRSYKKKKLLPLFLIFIIAFSGKFMYKDNFFSFSENVYKIPEEMIEICEVINEHYEDGEAFVATQNPVYIWLRQYDASIRIAYTKRGMGGDSDARELRELVESKDKDWDAIYRKCKEVTCNVVIVTIPEITEHEMSAYGFEILDYVDEYAIYRVSDKSVKKTIGVQ